MSTFNRESEVVYSTQMTLIILAVEIFINQISTHANTNQWFDMYPYLKRCALDIICCMLMMINSNLFEHFRYIDGHIGM
jgi:hypothetical protein